MWKKNTKVVEKMEVITRAIINVLHLFKRIQKEMRTKRIENYTKYSQETSKLKNTISKVKTKVGNVHAQSLSYV